MLDQRLGAHKRRILAGDLASRVQVQAMAGEPAGQLRFVHWWNGRRVEVARRRWWIQRHVRAHHVVVDRPDRGGSQVLVVGGGVVALFGEHLATPVQGLGLDGWIGITGEQLIPGAQGTGRVAAHVARQATTECAG